MKKVLISSLLACVSLSLFAQQQELPNDPEVRKGMLENGMTYYIRHNALPEGRAEFYLATDAGAILETPEQDGLAHFLEHMCFNGTQNFPGKGILNYLQSIGAEFGRNINASTGVEQTVYMLNNIPVTREGIVDTCLLIMHDYSHFVSCDSTEIDAERGVIIEEKRSRNSASWRLREKSLPYYYGDTKYAGCTIIGSQENLENFKPESLTDFYHTWYRPDLQALIVVGDIDVDAVESKIKSTFSDIPAAKDPKPKDVIAIPCNDDPIAGIITDPEASGTSLEIIWKSEPLPKELNSTVAAKMMDLVKVYISFIMRERFIDLSADSECPYISANVGMGKLCSTCEVVMGSVNCKEGMAEDCLRLFMTEFEKMKRYGFTDAEVNRAKDRIISMYDHAAESASTRKNPDFIDYYLDNFFENEPYMVPDQELEVVKAICTQINSRVLGQIASQLGGDKGLVILLKAPQKEGVSYPSEERLISIVKEVEASDIQPNEEETIQVDLLDPSSLPGAKKASKIKKDCFGASVWTLDNGMKVVVLPTSNKKDEVMLDLVWEGGCSILPTSALPSFEENIWKLFLSNAGVSKFSGIELPKILAGKRVSVNPYIHPYTHGVSGSSSVKDLETIFQMMYLMVADPRFDDSEYERGITQIADLLPNLEKQPSFRFQSEMMRTLYGNNPRKLVISQEVLDKASLSVLETNYRKLFHDAAGATLFIVGDVTVDTIKPLINKYMGSIAKGKKPHEWKNAGVGIVKGEVVNHFKVPMEAPKNTVLLVYSGYLPYTVRDEALLDAAEYLLDMKLIETLREQEGGTYSPGVSSSFVHLPVGRALMQIYFETNGEASAKLISLAKKAIADLAANGPAEEQLAMTIENFKKKIPEQRISNSYWMSMLSNWYLYQISYDDEYDEAVQKLDSKGIRALLGTMLSQGNLVEIEMAPQE